MNNHSISTLLAENLRKLMREQNLNPRQLSEKCKTSGRMISYILNQERVPNIEIVDDIASAFRMRGWELLAEDVGEKDGIIATLHEAADQEHVTMIKQLDEEEKKEIERYAKYIISSRDS